MCLNNNPTKRGSCQCKVTKYKGNNGNISGADTNKKSKAKRTKYIINIFRKIKRKIK